MAFYHGVERVEIPGFRPIRLVRAGVIGLVGIAPAGDAQALTLVTNETEAAQFGKEVPGFTIPQALAAIFKQGAGTVLVVNVFDADTHTATETDEAHVTANAKYTLDYAPIGPIVVTSNDGVTTYVAGTHYSVDEFGVVTILDLTAIPNGTTLKTTYDRLDASLVTSADIIGAVAGDSTRTGAKLLYTSYSKFQFRPKILLCPTFGESVAVRNEMLDISEKLFCRYIYDSASGTTNAQAITNRTTAGNALQTASKRAVICHPRILAYNSRTEANEATPFSQWLAGAWSAVIATKGYWFSPSNNAIKGVLGASGTVTFDPFNATGTDANNLNDAGIVTVGVDAARGPIVWVNRSAAHPTSTEFDNFLSVLLTADVIDESVLIASLAFLDGPVTFGLIDSVRETVNAFLRSQIAVGALVDGKNEDGRTTGCYFDEAKNPAEQLSNGQVVFTLVYCPPGPAERITYDRVIDIQFLNALTA